MYQVSLLPIPPPAENLVAAFQHNPAATLLAAAADCAGGRVMLEALETGTDGVLLQTDSAAEVGGRAALCCVCVVCCVGA